jgi:serine/threonine protein kinase
MANNSSAVVNISDIEVDFPKADWHKISVEGRDLIEKMLIVDPSARISPADALRYL